MTRRVGARDKLRDEGQGSYRPGMIIVYIGVKIMG